MNEIKGIIDHRILLNYRIDPLVMKQNLPSEFEPLTIKGYAIGGICQVSLSEMRPKGLPSLIGTKSHNSAHRIAVVSSKGEGVFVTRRDTNSIINTFSSGRLFPGDYKKADFQVDSENETYNVKISQKGNCLMNIKANASDKIEDSSIFDSVEEISDFFLRGNIGWSKKSENEGYDSIELKTIKWSMEPLKVTQEFSSYFTDETKFPKGSVEFDSAMVMKGIEHSWISRVELCNICS